MSRDEIMALSGDKLDAAVAEHVFGKPHWEQRPKPRVKGEPCGTTPEHCKAPLGNLQRWRDEMDEWAIHQNGKPVWYSKTMDYAWKVVRRMEAYTCDFALEKAGTLWHAEFLLNTASGDTAPEAICRAALLAVTQEAATA